MSSQLKPIKVWGDGGINPVKVTMIIAELSIPYETVKVLLADIKKPDYVAINPNGRLPAIHDPNTDITLWESGAIVEYLIERYDTAHKLSFAPGSADAAHAKQWAYFQASGQGPYYGQAAWFKWFAKEPVPMALERYAGEVNRVSGVLNDYLALQKEKGNVGGDGPWLVGNKCSYADLAFIMWQRVIAMVFTEGEYSIDNFTHVKEWFEKMTAREAVKKVLETSGRLE